MEDELDPNDLDATGTLSLREIAAEARRLAAKTSARQAELEDRLADSLEKLIGETRGLREYLREETPTYDELNKRLQEVEELADGRIRTIITFGSIIVVLAVLLSVLATEWGRNYCYLHQENQDFFCHVLYPMHDNLIVRR